MKKPLPLITGILLFGATFVIHSCGSDDEDPGGQPTPEFDREAMLTNYADNLILPAYDALKTSSDALSSAVDQFATDPTEANLGSVQSELKSARKAWQLANFYQFGPAETNTLRAAMNTYPTDVDKINNNIESGNYTLGSIDNIAAGGFPALDYLLHGLGESPDDFVEAYTTAPNAQARLTYLTDNATFVKTLVDNVVNAWEASTGDYRSTFLDPSNAGTGVGSSIGLLANAMVLHYERFMRDGKIGIPAGVRSAGVPRPTATEAFYAEYSAELAEDNIREFKNIFTGAGGSGLDDYLIFMESTALSNDIVSGIDQTISGASSLTDPLSKNIEDDNDQVITVFTSLQDVLVLIKVDMTSILGITITFQTMTAIR